MEMGNLVTQSELWKSINIVAKMYDSPAQFEVGWIPGIFEINNETMNA